MNSNIIVMPGTRRMNLPALREVAREFGWAVSALSSLNEVTAVSQGHTPVALLVSRDALGSGYSWPESIRLLKRSFPEARLVTCHGFSDRIDWEELSEAGAFHAIHLPLQENELRQAMGFVWQAETMERGPVMNGGHPVAFPTVIAC